MVKIRHAAMSIAAASVAGAGIFLGMPASAATMGSPHQAGSAHQAGSPHRAGPMRPARPMVSVNRNCGDGNTRGNEWDCLEIGQNPWYIRVSDEIIHSERTVQICLHKDGLSDVCTPFEVVQPGQTESAEWPYQGPGRYCALIWRLDKDGEHTLVDTGQCITMH